MKTGSPREKKQDSFTISDTETAVGVTEPVVGQPSLFARAWMKGNAGYQQQQSHATNGKRYTWRATQPDIRMWLVQ